MSPNGEAVKKSIVKSLEKSAYVWAIASLGFFLWFNRDFRIRNVSDLIFFVSFFDQAKKEKY
jgi:hypothetical protein